MGIGIHGYITGADPDIPTIRIGECAIANKSTFEIVGNYSITISLHLDYFAKLTKMAEKKLPFSLAPEIENLARISIASFSIPEDALLRYRENGLLESKMKVFSLK